MVRLALSLAAGLILLQACSGGVTQTRTIIEPVKCPLPPASKECRVDACPVDPLIPDDYLACGISNSRCYADVEVLRASPCFE